VYNKDGQQGQCKIIYMLCVTLILRVFYTVLAYNSDLKTADKTINFGIILYGCKTVTRYTCAIKTVVIKNFYVTLVLPE